MKKFLIIQTAFLGDVVLATSIAEKLHQLSPSIDIHFLVKKGYETVFDDHPYINNVLTWEKGKDKYKNLVLLLLEIQKQRYYAVINIQRFASTGFLTAFSNARHKIGFEKNPFSFLFTTVVKHIFRKDLHEIDRNQLLIDGFGDFFPAKPKLYPSQGHYFSIKPFTVERYICIAPTSVWLTKQFPVEKWVNLINLLPKDLNIYLLGSNTDFNLCETILEKSQPNSQVFNLAGKLSILETCALMKTAEMNYANDSAPVHFASSMNAPITVVFCSTLPTFGYGPLSDVSYIVETKELLSCRPCGIHGKKTCPKIHFNCANNIEESRLLIGLKNKKEYFTTK